MAGKLTQDLLHRLFDYQEDGSLLVKEPTYRRPAGLVLTGSPRRDGYREMSVEGTKHLMHRLIFLYHHGWLPTLIDHIDRDKSNNRIENLRDSSPSHNARNSSRHEEAVGVSTSGTKWYFDFMHEGKRYRGSGFDSKEEAKSVRSAIQRLITKGVK